MINIENYIYVNKNSISTELCNDIITRFDNDDNKCIGKTRLGVDTDYKNTTDLYLNRDDKQWDRLNILLSKELDYNIDAYKKHMNNIFKCNFDFLSDKHSYSCMQIQKYKKNEGVYKIHHDFVTDSSKKECRKLAFIWYLNNVENGGETEFLLQYRITPEAGKLVIFPACWTFPHAGLIPLSNDKYIITGWVWDRSE